MLPKDLLHLIVSVTLEVVNELLHRHQLDRDNHLDILLVFSFGCLALFVAWVEEFVERECLRISPNLLDCLAVLFLLLCLLPFVNIRDRVLAVLPSALRLGIPVLLLAACHVAWVATVVILALHGFQRGCEGIRID